MKTSLTLLMGCFLLVSSSLFAQKKYLLNDQNINSVMSKIDTHYGSSLINVSLQEIEDHLVRQLEFYDNIDPALPLPQSAYIGQVAGTCYFRWTDVGTSNTVQYTFKDLATGNTSVHHSSALGSAIIHSTQRFSLYTFLTFNNNSQSDVEIIIVDKDALRPSTPFSPKHNGHILADNQFDLSPNPIRHFGQITFNHQVAEGPVSVYVVEAATGKIKTNLLSKSQLDQGFQTLDLNTSDWSAGIYYCVIQGEQSVRQIPFVKLK